MKTLEELDNAPTRILVACVTKQEPEAILEQLRAFYPDWLERLIEAAGALDEAR